MKYNIIIAFILLILYSCEYDLTDVNIPKYGSESMLTNSLPLNDSILKNIEGIYNYIGETTEFGKTPVLKASKNHLSFFTDKNEAYMIFEGGIKDSSIIFEGYWRFASSDEAGLVRLIINKNNGAKELISGQKPKKITCQGTYLRGNSNTNRAFTLEYTKPLNNTGSDFYIIAHRGGGRNSDRLPASENSVEMILLAERFGANAIEIDVKLTKDKVPILFHDENLSLRLINQSYFVGSISNYTYAQLNSFVTLKNGEKIPTLEEALDAVIQQTNLKLVWLDIKSTGLIQDVVEIQKIYVNEIKSSGRNLEILIGLPTEEIADEFLEIENFRSIPSICELSSDYMKKTGALVWAPRWSLGFQDDDSYLLHQEGKRVFTWTLDESIFIKSYIDKGNFNGILSNYPSIVSYEYYTK